MSGFKAFLLRGNLVEHRSRHRHRRRFRDPGRCLRQGPDHPIIAALFGKPDFSGLYFTVNNSKILYGDFINVLIASLVIATVIYFFVVSPYARFQGALEPAAGPRAGHEQCPAASATFLRARLGVPSARPTCNRRRSYHT